MTTTMPRFRFVLALASLAAAPALGAAQTPVPMQPPAAPPPPTVGPPILRIETASAVSTEPLGAITSVMELPDGRVLVNDGTRRRLLVMDTTLAHAEVVLDSMSEIANTYGVRAGALLPYRGDSIMFIDPASYAIVVLDHNASIARVRSVWRVEHAPYFTSSLGTYGWPGVDSRGRVVYRIPAVPAPPLAPPPAGVPYFPPQPDSAFIIAFDLDSRRQDTLAVVRVPGSQMRVTQTASGGFSIMSAVNPLPVGDGWAVLPDGTLALVRALDYRIDYLYPDGTTSSSAKLPYDWQRLLDEDKERMVDSVRTVQQRSAASSYALNMIMWVNQYAKEFPKNFNVPDGFTLPPGLPRDWILPAGVSFPDNYVFACPPGVEPPAGSMPGMPGMAAMPGMVMVSGPPGAPPPGAPGAVAPGAAAPGAAPAAPACTAPMFGFGGGGVAPPMPTMRQVHVIAPRDLPDYRPPFAPTGAVRADLDGNLWIRTNPPRPGGVVYDIVSREGELVNRIQLPPGYTLVGFGRGKVVYLSMRDAQGIHLARVRLR